MSWSYFFAHFEISLLSNNQLRMTTKVRVMLMHAAADHFCTAQCYVLSQQKIFREINSLVKTLLSRNISQKCVNVNISNFHIVNDSLTLRLKMCSFTKIAWNQLFYEGKLISRNIFLVKVLFLSTHIEFILRLWNSLSLLHFRSVLYYLWQFMAELCY